MKPRWIRRGLWLAGFACLWLNVLDDPPLHTSSYLQDVTTTEATVAMISAHPTQVVCTVRDAEGVTVQVVQGSNRRRRHALRVRGLQPATNYTYTLVDAASGGQAQGRLRTASTDDHDPVKFAFLGDSGGQPWWVWLQRTPLFHWPARWGWLPDSEEVTAIGKAVDAYAPDFVLHLGDVVYPWGLHAHYASGFFRPFGTVLQNAPLYAVLGNHDLMDADGLQLLDNLQLPDNEVTGDGRCFSFARGPVRIVGLDCNTEQTGDRFEAGYPSYEFLAGELARCTEPWIVVASHFPIRSASRARDRGDLLLSLLPLLRRHSVNLYLSGHDHCYQRFGEPGEEGVIPLVVSGGGGKSLYEVHPHIHAIVLQSQYHWCGAEVMGKALRVRAFGLDAGIIDTFSVPLVSGVALARLRAENPARAARIDRF